MQLWCGIGLRIARFFHLIGCMRHFECLHRFDGVIGHDFGVGLLSSSVVGFRMLGLGTLVFRSVFGFASVLVGMRVRLQLLAGFDVLLR